MFTQDRKRTRAFFRACWQKHLAEETLEPLEKQVATLIAEHPEYHKLLTSRDDDALDADYNDEHGQGNPYMHLGLHLALREQVGTDRPKGISSLTRSLLLKHGDGHQVEHMMIAVLGEILWDAQRQQRPPDEELYLEKLRLLL